MRPVDADEFKKRIEPYNTNDKMEKAFYNFALNKINSTPTLNVEPMPKDYVWDRAGYYDKQVGHSDYVCHHCGHKVDYFICGDKEWWCIDIPNFCPYCGVEIEDEMFKGSNKE